MNTQLKPCECPLQPAQQTPRDIWKRLLTLHKNKHEHNTQTYHEPQTENREIERRLKRQNEQNLHQPKTQTKRHA